MKNFVYFLLIAPLFFISSCEEEGPVHGCLDSQACNYNPEATLDNNSCEYPPTGFDCDFVIDNNNVQQLVNSWLEDSVLTEAIYGNISNWDVSNVTQMDYMFNVASNFNGDLSSWDVSSVTDMSGMFRDATSFNGHIFDWDVSNVTNMNGVFLGATSFNGDISSWDVSNVANMAYMFQSAPSFNGDLSNWDVSSVTNMTYMFDGATSLSEENQCAIQESFSTNPNWEYDWCP